MTPIEDIFSEFAGRIQQARREEFSDEEIDDRRSKLRGMLFGTEY
jgi:hypothetical protein